MMLYNIIKEIECLISLLYKILLNDMISVSYRISLCVKFDFRKRI